MEGVAVRGYRCADEADLLRIWNDALVRDPIDVATFRRKVLLDPNFAGADLHVAEIEGALAGFCLSLRRRVPMEAPAIDDGERAWITAFGVAPGHRRQGLGAALLDAACSRLAAAGCTSVACAPYVPNYFVPGVDVEAYAEGLSFLINRGFVELDRPISMDTDLVRLDVAPHLAREAELLARGIEVRCLHACEIPRLLELLKTHMPPDWVRHARKILHEVAAGESGFEQFTVAARTRPDGEQEFVGYCQFDGEHFGPFGVIEALQGQGIGTILLGRCLQTMQRHGHHGAWVLWTSDHSGQHVYRRFGFTPTRRFAVLRREL